MNIDKVKEFHQKFGQKVSSSQEWDEKTAKRRYDLIREELDELQEGLLNKDPVEVFDALLDLEYVVLGSVLELGFYNKYQEGFDEVHNSNMSKLGEDGNPIYREDGKVLKGPNYFEPNLEKILGRG